MYEHRLGTHIYTSPCLHTYGSALSVKCCDHSTKPRRQQPSGHGHTTKPIGQQPCDYDHSTKPTSNHDRTTQSTGSSHAIMTTPRSPGGRGTWAGWHAWPAAPPGGVHGPSQR
mmetsp:Transcript_23399/g.51366  ORF Transcript_23399/g.51366 Transcript_23399/m.51366 type:complete len:113 (+) Transcript_23399:256-594(+)